MFFHPKKWNNNATKSRRHQVAQKADIQSILLVNFGDLVFWWHFLSKSTTVHC